MSSPPTSPRLTIPWLWHKAPLDALWRDTQGSCGTVCAGQPGATRDFYKVIRKSPSDADAITNKASAQQNQWEAKILDSRYLILRGYTAKTYKNLKFSQVSLLRSFKRKSRAAQSPQLCLETGIPSPGNVYCLERSFRAERPWPVVTCQNTLTWRPS